MARRDEFDDPEGFFSRLMTEGDSSNGLRWGARSLWISGALFVGVVALSGVIWASYPSQGPFLEGGAVPIIRADQEAYKYVPQDRGGMTIAYQDSTVFDAMRGSPRGGPENLLNESDETPLDRAQLFAGLKTDVKDVQGASAQMARMEDYTQDRPVTEKERRAMAARRNRDQLTEPAAPLPGDIDTSSGAVPGVLNGREVKPDMAKENIENDKGEGVATSIPEKEKPQKKPAKTQVKKEDRKSSSAPTPTADKTEQKSAPLPSATPSSVGGTSYVQVSSMPSASMVEAELSKLMVKLPMLAGQAYRVKTAEVRGVTMHRIQVGPMSKEAAKALCDAIKAKKPGGCLVVK